MNIHALVKVVSRQALAVALLALLCSVPVWSQDANVLVTAGRLHLERRELASAEARFADAIAQQPTHPTANALLGYVRLLRIPEQPAVSNLLSAVAVESSGRDLRSWSAGFRKLTNGAPAISRNYNTATANEVVRSNVFVTLDLVRSNLALAAVPGFQVRLNAKETGADEVTVDQADLVAMQAGIHFAEFFLRSLHPWQLEETAGRIVDLMEEGDLTVERLRADYPEIFSFKDLEDLVLAKDHLTGADARYAQAYALMQGRPTNSVFLLNLEPDQRETEEQFRKTLAELARSTSLPTKLSMDTNVVLHLGPFFSGAATLHNLAPDFVENGMVAGSWPSSDFRGILPGGDMDRISEKIAEVIDVVPQIRNPIWLPGNAILVEARTVGEQKVLLQESDDIERWSNLEVRRGDKGRTSFLLDAKDAEGRFFRLMSLEAPTVLVKVVDSVTSEPIPNATVRVVIYGTHYMGWSGDNGIALIEAWLSPLIPGSISASIDFTPGYSTAVEQFMVNPANHADIVFRAKRL
jgi:hypothetical protein